MPEKAPKPDVIAVETTRLAGGPYRTYMTCQASGVANVLPSPVTAHEASSWPEFKALIRRLGLDPDMPITDFQLTMNMDETVNMVVGLRGIDASKTGEKT